MIVGVYVFAVTVLYTVFIGQWILNTFIFAYIKPTDCSVKWGADDVQVRILTVDDADTVRETVSSAIELFSDVIVISENELDNVDCPVNVVPDEFDCEAIRKGRALEWANQTIETDKQYILYLDEDTIVNEFNGMPDADIIQFTETPTYTGSYISFLTDIFRVGYQVEQRGFSFYRHPIYAWGGGIAIRNSIEEEVTWNFRTLTEDTSFVWRASQRFQNLTFGVVETGFQNQAPTSIRSLFKQRRRWISGTVADVGTLPILYRVLIYIRILAWVFSPLLLLNGVLIFYYPSELVTSTVFAGVVAFQIFFLFITTIIGLFHYDDLPLHVFLAIPLTPVLTTINSIGALWGLIEPAVDFEVTEKLRQD